MSTPIGDSLRWGDVTPGPDMSGWGDLDSLTLQELNTAIGLFNAAVARKLTSLSGMVIPAAPRPMTDTGTVGRSPLAVNP